jgi:hypothetical protein
LTVGRERVFAKLIGSGGSGFLPRAGTVRYWRKVNKSIQVRLHLLVEYLDSWNAL